MDTLLANAQKILETARFSGSGPVTILIRDGRPIHLTIANDWSLEALLFERQADEAFRVYRKQGCLTVEGRSRTRSCSVSEKPLPFPAMALLPQWQNVA